MKATEEKAIRLVLDDRVTIKWRNDDHTAGDGMVKGDSALYRAGFSPEGRWCTCPAGVNNVDCSHAIAVELHLKAIEAGVDLTPTERTGPNILDEMLNPSQRATYTITVEKQT